MKTTTIERPSTAPKGADIQIESPKATEDRPADGPFTSDHFAALAIEWDRMRKLPDDTSWNMDHFQWNGVGAALRIASECTAALVGEQVEPEAAMIRPINLLGDFLKEWTRPEVVVVVSGDDPDAYRDLVLDITQMQERLAGLLTGSR